MKTKVKEFIATMILSISLLMFAFLICFAIDRTFLVEISSNQWLVALALSFVIFLCLWIFIKLIKWAIENI